MKIVDPIGTLIPTILPEPHLLTDLPGAWSLANSPTFASDTHGNYVLACHDYIGISRRPHKHWFLWPAQARIPPKPTPPSPSCNKKFLHAHYRSFQRDQRLLDFKTTIHPAYEVKHTLTTHLTHDTVSLKDIYFGHNTYHFMLYGALFYLMEPDTHTAFSLGTEAKQLYIAARLLDSDSQLKTSFRNKIDAYEKAFQALEKELDGLQHDPGKNIFVRMLMAICRYRMGCLIQFDSDFYDSGAHMFFSEATDLLSYYGFRRSTVGIAFRNEINAKLRQL
ncbi:MAG: hypothetical protein ABII18_01830 [bacterium]|nr:hypothetical protein [bacterium]MBU1917567.1 hypothetical protein [bacterium]